MTASVVMEPIYQRPEKYFSRDVGQYLMLQHVTIREPFPPLLEDDFVLLYVLRGSGSVTVNGLSVSLTAGCACTFETFHVFTILPNAGDPLECAIIAVDSVLRSYLSFESISSDENNKIFDSFPMVPLSGRARERFEALLKKFGREDSIADDQSPLIKTALFGQMQVLINQQRNHPHDTHCSTPGWNMLLYLTKFNSHRLKLEDVAAEFGCTPSEVNRELRRISSYSFAQLLARSRINTACALLLMENFSFHYIASYMGFGSENSFYRAFRIYRGTTPQQYREQMLSQCNVQPRKVICETPLTVLNYIARNFRNPITLKTAAADLYLSEAAINTALKQYFQVSFRACLTNHRLHFAEALLICSPMPVCDVAVNSGFNSVHTFTRLFKSKYGVTPGEYRRQKGGDL